MHEGIVNSHDITGSWICGKSWKHCWCCLLYNPVL